MTTDAVTLFFALLAVGAQAAAVGLALLAVGGAMSGRLAALRSRLMAALGPQALALALVVAVVATGGSLYLSEVAGFPPCRLCWYQRYAMYPLVPLLAVAALRRWTAVRFVVLPVAVVGAAISTWHVLVERYPTLETGACDPTNPCSLVWVRRFGYLTIPTMALSAFVLIAAIMLTIRPNHD